MSYTFKRLAEVEEIQEAPETAKAFVEVNGEVKRAPYGAGGGGVNLNELRFDLDIVEEAGYIHFNTEQIRKVLENDMNIVIIRRTPACGTYNFKVDTFYRCQSTVASGKIPLIPTTVYGNPYSDNTSITVEVGSDGNPTSAKLKKVSGDEYSMFYATI